MDITNLVAVSNATISILSRYWQEERKEDAKIEELYRLIKEKFSNDSSAVEFFNDFEKNPTDPDIQASIRLFVRKNMSSDVNFASKLEKLVKSDSELSKDVMKRIEKVLSSKTAMSTIAGGAIIGSALIPIPALGSILGAVAGLVTTSFLDSEVLKELTKKAESTTEGEQVEK